MTPLSYLTQNLTLEHDLASGGNRTVFRSFLFPPESSKDSPNGEVSISSFGSTAWRTYLRATRRCRSTQASRNRSCCSSANPAGIEPAACPAPTRGVRTLWECSRVTYVPKAFVQSERAMTSSDRHWLSDPMPTRPHLRRSRAASEVVSFDSAFPKLWLERVELTQRAARALFARPSLPQRGPVDD